MGKMKVRSTCWMTVVLAVGMVLFCAGNLKAQYVGGGVDDPNGVFQLEGNATTEAFICFETAANGGPALATPGAGNSCPSGFTLVAFGPNSTVYPGTNNTTYDWDSAFGVALASTMVNGVAGPVPDMFNTNSDNIFFQGKSKDIYDVSQWKWTAGRPQGKDDIEHAFATAFRLPNGHTAIFFGMDRFDNSGDATAGFWFFKDPTVSMCTGKGTPQPSCTASGQFSGNHSDGDLLIISDFSTGGAVSTIAVYTWSSAANGPVLATLSTPSGECDPTVGNNGLCAIVNPQNVPAAWSFIDKSGNTFYAHGELLEGGIDLDAVFPGGAPCFSVFMAETRSSTAINSTLSDFSPPASFNLCSDSINKSCPGTVGATTYPVLNQAGTEWTYAFGGEVHNTGSSTLYNVTVTDTFDSSVLASSISPAGSGSGLVRTYDLTSFLPNGLAPGGCIRWPTGTACQSNPANLTSADFGTFQSRPTEGCWTAPPSPLPRFQEAA